VVGLSQGFSPAADETPAPGCATLAAEYDWAQSDFGPQDLWDPAVEAVVRTLLETTAPMAYCHGEGYAMVYNDRFAALLGAKHPRSWGQRAAAVLPEVWARPGFAEAIDTLFDGGPPFHDDGEMVDLTGREESNPDWAYLARSYSAVRDSDGLVLGILIVVVEVAPVLVLVNGAEQGDQGAARWHGAELWDETGARGPLIWSGFRAGARAPEPAGASSASRRGRPRHRPGRRIPSRRLDALPEGLGPRHRHRPPCRQASAGRARELKPGLSRDAPHAQIGRFRLASPTRSAVCSG